MILSLLLFFRRHLFVAFLLFVSASMPVQAALDIELEGMDGQSHNLSAYIGKGKWTILNFWGPKCPPCREEMPDLVQFHDERHTKDAIVVGIAIDFPSYKYANKNQVAAFAEDFMIDFTILLSDGDITQKIGLGPLLGLPTTFIFSPEGNVVGAQVGGITKIIIEDFINKQAVKRKLSD